MDELTLLRKVRDDVADPTPEALTRGRAALFERIAETAPTRATRRRGIRIAGLSALGAGAVVTTLVLTNIVGLAGWRGGADAAAAEVLHDAAIATIKTSDPLVAPGQYLRVATTAMNLVGVQSANGGFANFLVIVEDELYLPADRSDDWIWARHPWKTYQTFGPASEEASKQHRDDPGPGNSEELLQAPAGAFYGGPPTMTYSDLDGLPRDPVQLLNYIYRVTVGAGPSPDGEALVFIADRLRTGVVPADLRAAFFSAAALIPGVSISENQATLNGRTGIAIGRDEGTSFRQEIIIDPATGQFIGEREISLTDGIYAGLPAGTVVGWSAVTTSVVNSAPQGGTANGIFDVMGCVSDGKGGTQCPTK